jgi:hypothetical protein
MAQKAQNELGRNKIDDVNLPACFQQIAAGN